MRRVLVLGGTGWLGSRIVAALVASGAEVTCLARGESPFEAAGARRVRADRLLPGAYDALGGEWDEVIELAYDPALVVGALESLADRAAHWTLVSSVSVYANNDQPGADESATVVEPQDLDVYPDAKVAAERVSAARLGDRLLVVRPGLIAGPGDPSDRLGYWPARFSRPGPVLAPSLEGRFVQYVDVNDLAEWIARAGSEGRTGCVNAVGPAMPLREFLAAAAEAAGFADELVEADDAALLGLGINYWAGPRSLPLWLPAEDTGFMQRTATEFAASGGPARTLPESLASIRADELSRGLDRPRRSGLTVHEEAEALVALAGRH